MDIHGIDNPENKRYIGEYYDKNSHSFKDAYVIHFMTGPEGADVIISLDFKWTMICCYACRSHYGAGFDDSGSCYYDFPETESIEYLNIIAFIKENTFVGSSYSKVMPRDEYESILDTIGYTE